MRIPKPFYRKARKCWYVELDRKQIRLSPNKQEAYTEYYRLMLARGPRDEDLKDPRVTVVGLCQRFIAWQKENSKDSTYWFYAVPLESFTGFLGGDKQVRDLTPDDVERWLVKLYPKAGKSYKHNLIRAAKRPFAWAKKKRYISTNPLADVEQCGQESRDCYITPEQWESFLGVLEPGPFLDLVIVLRATGARPEEIRAVEKRHVNARHRCLEIPASEAKGHVKRVIHLDDAEGIAFKIVERLANEHPTGPLFRNAKGRPWTGGTVAGRFAYLQKKLGFPVSVYSLRHTYATDALAADVDCQTVASQLGHRGLATLYKHYQHLIKKTAYMQAAQVKATKGVRLSI
jgi:integrase